MSKMGLGSIMEHIPHLTRLTRFQLSN